MTTKQKLLQKIKNMARIHGFYDLLKLREDNICKTPPGFKRQPSTFSWFTSETESDIQDNVQIPSVGSVLTMKESVKGRVLLIKKSGCYELVLDLDSYHEVG